MAGISQQLRNEFQRALKSRLLPFVESAGKGQGEEIKSVDQLIRGGHNPVHALYLNVNNLISVFTEEVTSLPLMHRAYDFLAKWQDIYSPGYPPMSPITTSYFACWTSYDVTFGKENESIGACLLALSDLLELDPLQIEAASNLCQSRMGIYVVMGATNSCFRLREPITDLEFDALIPSGFKGKPGDLIYIRLLPPVPACNLPHIGMTTPYVLVGNKETDWLEYFKRFQIIPGTVGCEERLRRHFKEGKDNTYWSEFVFYGYLNHRADAIYLMGFPDLPQTQPHHDDFDDRTMKWALAGSLSGDFTPS